MGQSYPTVYMPTVRLGSIGAKTRELIDRWGHSVPEGGYGWRQECVKCLGIDPRVFYYSEAEKTALGISTDYGYCYSCWGYHDNLLPDGVLCNEPYPGNEKYTLWRGSCDAWV